MSWNSSTAYATCKDVGIELCPQCNISEKWGCIIRTYRAHIIHLLDKVDDIKPELVSIIKTGCCEHGGGFRVNSLPYFAATIKYYYPEYHDWFQKMLILK